jgi:pilin isopeptide linkage protein
VPIPRVFYPTDTTFNNVYKASGSVALEAGAALKGRGLREGEFSFELRLGKELLQTKANGLDGAIVFDPILYTQADIGMTYSYKISEIRSSEAGITYPAEPKTVKVTISDAGNGSLNAAAEYSRNMTFNNSYKAAGQADLVFRAELQNRAIEDKEFNFELRLGGKALQNKTNGKTGEVAFKPIRFTQEDIGKAYVYEVLQVPGKETGMTYDPSVKTVQVSVTDTGNGILDAEVLYLTDTLMVNRFDPSADPTLLSGNWNLNLTITGYTPEDLDTNIKTGDSFDQKWALEMEPEGLGTVTAYKGSWSAAFLSGVFKSTLESENTIFQYEGALSMQNGVMTITGGYVETHPGHVIYADMVLTKEK